MRRKSVSEVTLTLLIVTLTLAFSVQRVKSTSSVEYVEGFNIDQLIDPRTDYEADWFGIEYTPSVSYNLKKVELVAGGGTGSCIVQLRPDSQGMPSGTILRETSFSQVSTVSWQGAEFAESYPITADTIYWIVFKPILYSQASIAQSGTLVPHVWGTGGDSWEGKETLFPWMAKFYKETVTPPMTIAAIVNVEPNTLNLRSRGRWVTAFIELPEDYAATDIDISTVRLNDAVSAELHPIEIGEHHLMVKFSREDLIAILSVGEATLAVTGKVNGTPFEGLDTIKVIG